MTTRQSALLGVVILSCLPQGVAAKYPEMGGPRQFDLYCRGQEKQVVEPYLPFHMSGMPGAKTRYSVKRHITVDMIAMKFQVKPPYYSGAPPEKIASYDPNEGVLILRNDPQLARRWAIRLGKYNSTFVNEGESGEIWVEHMTCRLAPFSGFD